MGGLWSSPRPLLNWRQSGADRNPAIGVDRAQMKDDAWLLRVGQRSDGWLLIPGVRVRYGLPVRIDVSVVQSPSCDLGHKWCQQGLE